MTYAQKESAMIRKMRETKYAAFGGNKDKALEFVGARLKAFPDYANIVVREQIMTPIWRVQYDGQDFRDRISDIDRQRRSAHDAAIMSVNILNRMCDKMGLPAYADIDTNDRHAVADFVGQYVNEIYNNGINGGMDSATLGRDRGYDSEKLDARLRALDESFDTQQNNDQEVTFS